MLTLALALLAISLPHSSALPAPESLRRDVSEAIKSVRCADGLLPTPKYGLENASFSVCTEEIIHAPSSLIYNALLDFRQYHVWNTFVTEVQLPAAVQTPADVYPGLDIVFTTQGLVPGVDTLSIEIVTLLDPPAPHKQPAKWKDWNHDDGYSIVAWESGVAVQAEHPTSLQELGGGNVRMISWETYYRPNDTVVLPIAGALQSAFVQQGRDLKAYVEGLI
ncbi:hypothetical protein LTR05_007642 [Lithohypha guttulata]|uniref:Uncharacterized protein n=1 Tax=Lithohypha guttulata TaxID=1690604 RepID=A0AAN7STZ0_9EURO|nr:hypothetical protein LTR05_007642 [Lithohypha guttulata]